MANRVIVVKLGSTSVTREDGSPDAGLLASVAGQLVSLRAGGTRPVVVSSGAVATGLATLGRTTRPSDVAVLQAASAVGQPQVVRAWQDALGLHGVVVGQVLLDASDLFSRRQYLLARRTFAALFELGAIPIVNENDAVADEEIRFGDNDRLAALVAVLVGASRLVLLTDTPGLFTEDPATNASATLIDEVTEIDHELVAAAGTSSGPLGTGGMASKLAAARLATWSGIETVIADARDDDVVVRLEGSLGVASTTFRARAPALPARKAWIAFASASTGRLVVDDGARRALRGGASLLLAGVRSVEGAFDVGDAVEVHAEGALVAKGLSRCSSSELARRGAATPVPRDVVVVHHDDLVTLD